MNFLRLNAVTSAVVKSNHSPFKAYAFASGEINIL